MMMTRVKFIEIRDRSTFIPAVAVDCSLSGNSYADYLLRRAGYGTNRCVMLTRLSGGHANYDPYGWDNRTMKVAHNYIADHWDEIADAEVIDVEHILGETAEPKVSERYENRAA
jgi:hypothetical protein